MACRHLCAPLLTLLPLLAAAGPDDTAAAAPTPPTNQAPAPATTPADVAAPVTAAPTARAVVLRANALIPLRFLESVASNTHRAGAMFRMEVTDDITADEVVVIPAGSIAMGEVIHAAPAGGLGKAGELIASARYVLAGDREIKLRTGLGAAAGRSNIGAAFFVPFVRGKQALIAAETEVVAKTATDESFEAPAAREPGTPP
jgi:hypothetical protein